MTRILPAHTRCNEASPGTRTCVGNLVKSEPPTSAQRLSRWSRGLEATLESAMPLGAFRKGQGSVSGKACHEMETSSVRVLLNRESVFCFWETVSEKMARHL